MKECSYCENLGIDSFLDNEYGEIIFSKCTITGNNVSDTVNKCNDFVKCEKNILNMNFGMIFMENNHVFLCLEENK